MSALPGSDLMLMCRCHISLCPAAEGFAIEQDAPARRRRRALSCLTSNFAACLGCPAAEVFDVERDALQGGDALFYYKSAGSSGGGTGGGGGRRRASAEEALRSGAVWGELFVCALESSGNSGWRHRTER